jgi:hypothetical protein
MKEVFNNISANYTYVDVNEFSSITTTAPITGATTSNSSCNTISYNPNIFTTTGDLNLTSSSTSISTSTTGTNAIFIDNFNSKEAFVKNILDRIIEIKSLTKKAFYEFFDIKKIEYFKNKTKIICTKDVDLEYVDELKNESQILLECIDVPSDNYKQKAIKQDRNLSSLIYNGDGIIWTNGTNNTITIDPSIYNLTNVNTTTTNINYNNYITYTA